MASDGAAMRAADELLDPDALGALIEDCGTDMLVLLVDSLAEEGRGHLDALDRAGARGDARAAVAALHALRGAALGFGLTALVGDAARLERAAAAGTVPGAAERRHLDRRLAVSLDALRDWCAAMAG